MRSQNQMKRTVSIVLICIYAFSFTELHQLFKLPVLIQHFNEHQKLNGDLTFFQFLTLHYTTPQNHDEHDAELPFKDFGHCTVVQTVILPYAKIELKEKTPTVSAISYAVFYKKIIPSSYLSEIWQPPRL